MVVGTSFKSFFILNLAVVTMDGEKQHGEELIGGGDDKGVEGGYRAENERLGKEERG